MQSVFASYAPVLIFGCVSAIIAAAMLGMALVCGHQKPYPEKLTAYECGFSAFGDSHRRFDIRFYLVAILFIVFDLEIAFLFPWAISLGRIGVFGFLSMLLFLIILGVGFLYEWRMGALDWD